MYPQSSFHLPLLKIVINGDCFRVNKFPASFSELEEVVRMRYDNRLPENFCFKYEDSDNDSINVENQSDFEAFLEYICSEQLRSVKLRVDSKSFKQYFHSHPQNTALGSLLNPFLTSYQSIQPGKASVSTSTAAAAGKSTLQFNSPVDVNSLLMQLVKLWSQQHSGQAVPTPFQWNHHSAVRNSQQEKQGGGMGGGGIGVYFGGNIQGTNTQNHSMSSQAAQMPILSKRTSEVNSANDILCGTSLFMKRLNSANAAVSQLNEVAGAGAFVCISSPIAMQAVNFSAEGSNLSFANSKRDQKYAANAVYNHESIHECLEKLDLSDQNEPVFVTEKAAALNLIQESSQMTDGNPPPPPLITYFNNPQRQSQHNSNNTGNAETIFFFNNKTQSYFGQQSGMITLPEESQQQQQQAMVANSKGLPVSSHSHSPSYSQLSILQTSANLSGYTRTNANELHYLSENNGNSRQRGSTLSSEQPPPKGGNTQVNATPYWVSSRQKQTKTAALDALFVTSTLDSLSDRGILDMLEENPHLQGILRSVLALKQAECLTVQVQSLNEGKEQQQQQQQLEQLNASLQKFLERPTQEVISKLFQGQQQQEQQPHSIEIGGGIEREVWRQGGGDSKDKPELLTEDSRNEIEKSCCYTGPSLTHSPLLISQGHSFHTSQLLNLPPNIHSTAVASKNRDTNQWKGMFRLQDEQSREEEDSNKKTRKDGKQDETISLLALQLQSAKQSAEQAQEYPMLIEKQVSVLTANFPSQEGNLYGESRRLEDLIEVTSKSEPLGGEDSSRSSSNSSISSSEQKGSGEEEGSIDFVCLKTVYLFAQQPLNQSSANKLHHSQTFPSAGRLSLCSSFTAASPQFKAKLLYSYYSNEPLSDGSYLVFLEILNNGAENWPDNVYLKCISGVTDSSCYPIIQTNKNEATSIAFSIRLPASLSNENELSAKTAWRLYYTQDFEEKKFFGPKITIEFALNDQSSSPVAAFEETNLEVMATVIDLMKKIFPKDDEDILETLVRSKGRVIVKKWLADSKNERQISKLIMKFIAFYVPVRHEQRKALLALGGGNFSMESSQRISPERTRITEPRGQHQKQHQMHESAH